jgi:hypothetical protein
VFSLAVGVDLPSLGGLEWWASRPLWLAMALALTAVAALATSRFENHRGSVDADSRRRVGVSVFLALIGLVLLLWQGTTVATAIIALSLMLAALRLTTPARTPDPRPLPVGASG